jgi:hypothetical protein
MTASRFGGYGIGDRVIWANPYGIDKRPGEVAGYGRNGDLVIRDPETNTTVHVHHTHLEGIDPDNERDYSHERGPVLEPERCHACSLPAVDWVIGAYRTLPVCSVCRWARSRQWAARDYGWRANWMRGW